MHHMRDPLRSKSSQRRKLKSPICIKEKIKQLEQKVAHKDPKRQDGKEKVYEREKPPLLKADTPKIEEISPLKKLERYSHPGHLTDKHANSIFSPPKQPIFSKRVSQQESKEATPNKQQVKLLRRQSEREVESHMREGSKDQEGLVRLKEENQRFKQIYGRSQEKMQQLEQMLRDIKGKHESEKLVLQKTIDNLQRRIEEKKITLGHIFAYDDKGNNFLMVQDKIIAETDNQNSSPPDVPSKRESNLASIKLRLTPDFSDLSLESK